MRVKLVNDLLLLDVLAVLLLVVVIFFPSNALRIVLGLPFVLFFPGHALLAALSPRRYALYSIERVALSLGLSVVIAILIGIILNYLPWGIRLYPIVISFTVFLLVTSLVAWYRRLRLPEAERPGISLRLRLPSWRPRSVPVIILFVVLGVTVVGALGTLGYVASLPKGGEGFTQFYILGPEGRAENYPERVVVGTETEVLVTVINQEHETASYRVQVKINGVEDFEIGPVQLEHQEKWEGTVRFSMNRVGNNQLVEFLLYRGDESEPYLEPLHLWIDVRE
jgi:uncharacterized membrane protein